MDCLMNSLEKEILVEIVEPTMVFNLPTWNITQQPATLFSSKIQIVLKLSFIQTYRFQRIVIDFPVYKCYKSHTFGFTDTLNFHFI